MSKYKPPICESTVDPSLVRGGRDAEITDSVSMAAKGLKDHSEGEKAVLET